MSSQIKLSIKGASVPWLCSDHFITPNNWLSMLTAPTLPCVTCPLLSVCPFQTLPLHSRVESRPILWKTFLPVVLKSYPNPPLSLYDQNGLSKDLPLPGQELFLN